MINILDRQVGEIMQTLQELGLSENTLVIFTSDNGPHQAGGGDPEFFDSNGPLKGFKRDLYEGGIRVPMIAYWKDKIAAGSSSEHVSAFWDIFPTFSELTGVQAPDNIDGISFLPTLLGHSEEQKQHDYLYWEFPSYTGQQAVRMGKWKAVIQDMRKGNTTMELYDLEQDLQEQNDLAAQYPEIVDSIRAIMKAEHTPAVIPRWVIPGLD